MTNHIPGALGMHVRDGRLVPCVCGGPVPPRSRGYVAIEAPAFRDPRSFREMWESSSNSERWLVAGSLAALLIGVLILGQLG